MEIKEWLRHSHRSYNGIKKRACFFMYHNDLWKFSVNYGCILFLMNSKKWHVFPLKCQSLQRKTKLWVYNHRILCRKFYQRKISNVLNILVSFWVCFPFPWDQIVSLIFFSVMYSFFYAFLFLSLFYIYFCFLTLTSLLLFNGYIGFYGLSWISYWRRCVTKFKVLCTETFYWLVFILLAYEILPRF